MAIHLSHLLVIIVVLVVIQPLVQSRNIQESLKSIQNLGESQKGQTVKGLHEIKSYLNRFGYLNYDQTADLTSADEFDENLGEAIKTYQKNFGLNVTGELDSKTVEQMAMPRCGVPDNNMGLQYAFFDENNLRWSHLDLTYSFDSSVTRKTLPKIRAACKVAFPAWRKAAGGKFTFTEKPDGGDIKIGFYRLAHGDKTPFDGPGGQLAHTAPPNYGEVHIDADEDWSNNAKGDQFDLPSVLVHELGHALGLAHTTVKQAVMFAGIGRANIKRTPRSDDIKGIKALYGF